MPRFKTCPECGGVFADDGHARCPKHRGSGRDFRSPTTRAQDAEYRRERAKLFEIFDTQPTVPCAHRCGTRLTRATATADHVRSVAKGGKHQGNLVLSCAPCNGSKADGHAPRRRAAREPAEAPAPAPRRGGTRLA